MRKIIAIVYFLLTPFCTIHAQSVSPATVNAGAGMFFIGTTLFDWSVGEMTLISTFTNSSVIITQGVLQPYELPNTGFSDPGLRKKLRVFPNPAASDVNIMLESDEPGTLTYRLVDMLGRALLNATENAGAGVTTKHLDISGLACATYMLEVTITTEKGIKRTSYKIQKNK